MPGRGILQRIHHPSGVRTLQWHDGHHGPGVVGRSRPAPTSATHPSGAPAFGPRSRRGSDSGLRSLGALQTQPQPSPRPARSSAWAAAAPSSQWRPRRTRPAASECWRFDGDRGDPPGRCPRSSAQAQQASFGDSPCSFSCLPARRARPRVASSRVSSTRSGSALPRGVWDALVRHMPEDLQSLHRGVALPHRGVIQARLQQTVLGLRATVLISAVRQLCENPSSSREHRVFPTEDVSGRIMVLESMR
jgi:hypothetical protein